MTATPVYNSTIEESFFPSPLRDRATFGSAWRPAEHSGADSSTSVVADFARLADEWRRSVGASSLRSRRYSDPAYQKIVALQWPVVRLLIADLRSGNLEWVPALEEITKTVPVLEPHENPQSFKAAASAWITWGQKNGF